MKKFFVDCVCSSAFWFGISLTLLFEFFSASIILALERF